MKWGAGEGGQKEERKVIQGVLLKGEGKGEGKEKEKEGE